jgi:hypothetical protein
MATIEELIEYHHENEYLDFKKEEYTKANRHELIKDVLAFANADYEGSRYIIIGIKKENNEIAVFHIEAPTDSASIQQIIQSNITPEVDVSYYPYLYRASNLMILEIKNTTEKPYFPKKTVIVNSKPFLKENSSVIRKGSYTLDLKLPDIETIYKKKFNKANRFAGFLEFNFFDSKNKSIKLETIENITLPSEREWHRLHNKIVQIENRLAAEQEKDVIRIFDNIKVLRQEHTRLKLELDSVKGSFMAQDNYYVMEQTAHKLQFVVYNGGNEPIKDATLVIETPAIEGLIISTEVLSHPNITISHDESAPIFGAMHYPEVEINNEHFYIKAQIGDIKHKIPEKVLKVPLRVVLTPELIGKVLLLTCYVHGTNLPDPMKFELQIEVI